MKVLLVFDSFFFFFLVAGVKMETGILCFNFLDIDKRKKF